MKKIYSLILFLSFVIGSAQTPYYPATYFNMATGTGYELRNQLKQIISTGYIDTGYTPGLWITYQTSDRDNYYDLDNSILDIYSEKPATADSYSYLYQTNQCGSGSSDAEGECYNREHIVPQFFFTVNNQPLFPMYSDAHYIVPTDRYVNDYRSAYPFGKVGASVTFTSTNGSKLGQAINSGYAAGYSGIVFEPIDEFKGDIARMMFYFVTRYQDDMTTWGTSFNMFYANPPGNTGQIFTNTFKNILLAWHNQDPVSQREIDRNNAISARQHNRNPFIDHPEWVATIWGSTLQTETFNLLNAISVFPNPSIDGKITINSEFILDEIKFMNTNGQIVKQIVNPVSINNTYSLENLPQGFYLLKLTLNNQSITKKIIIN